MKGTRFIEKPLSVMTEREWEAICMKCGKCCLYKESNGERVFFLNLVCDGLDTCSGKCSRYKTRICADCAKVDINLLQTQPELLPETCAYRLLWDNKPLPDYHPLVSGNPNSVHEAGQTVLELPHLISAKAFKERMNKIAEKNAREHWSTEKLSKVLDKALAKEGLEIVESWPIPEKPIKKDAV
jgi:hypothetical protein